MLRVTIISQSGFSAPAATAAPENPAGDEIPVIPSAYEAIDNFVVDIKFEGKYEVITEGAIDPITGLAGESTISYVYQNAVNVTSSYDWSSYGVVMSKPNAYTVRLTGPANNVFTDQYYQFTLPDFSSAVLPPDTTVPFLSITRYNKPASNSITTTYPFAVTLPSTYSGLTNTVQNTTMDQTFWWAFSVAKANVLRLRSQGLR